MRAAPLLLLLLLPQPGHAEPGRTYVTELGRRVLSGSDQVVVARVARVLPPFRGITTARLDVTRKLAGYDRATSIVLMFIEDYRAPDAFVATLDSATIRYERRRKAGLGKYLEDLANLRRPRAEEEMTNVREVKTDREQVEAMRAGIGVRLAEGEEGLFFLRRQEASYAMVGFVPTRDPLYECKLERLEAVLRIEAAPSYDARAEAAKEYFLGSLEVENPWERGNSAREISSLAVRYPRLFTTEEAHQIADALFDEKEPPIRASLERAVGSLDPSAALAYAQRAEAAAAEANAQELAKAQAVIDQTRMPELRAAEIVRAARTYGRAATGMLTRYLADPEPLVRERTAQALAEEGGPSSRDPLRAALAKETDREAALALLYACGVRADPEAVPAVAKRLTDPDLERAAVHALARIGTPDARKALERHRPRADAETQDLITTLLREEFTDRS